MPRALRVSLNASTISLFWENSLRHEPNQTGRDGSDAVLRSKDGAICPATVEFARASDDKCNYKRPDGIAQANKASRETADGNRCDLKNRVSN